MSKRILIVGGVAGGATAAARMRRLDEQAEVILFERGEYISFANCGLPYYIGDVITEKARLTLQTPASFHARFGVDVRVNSEVTAIDRINKTVTVKETSGKTYTETYDYLVLSPGAAPVVPPISGAKNENIFTLRNIPDTYRIKDYCTNHKPAHAVVIGAGYIGLEMAENLHELGIEVEILELSDHVVGPLDAEMAADVHRHIAQKGVKLRLGHGVTAIEQEDDRTAVKLDDGTDIITDMIIMAVGVRPETVLARESGLALGDRGGIAVDTHMRTNDPAIFAVGDAVEVVDFVTGAHALVPLASPANKQGRIAADNIHGIASEYGGTQGTAILKVFDMTVAMTGANERSLQRAGMEYEKSYTYSASHAGYYPGSTMMSIKLLFNKQSGKVLGAQIVGYDGVDKRCDVLATAIRAGMTVGDLTVLELAYAPPFSSAKDPVNMAGYVAENIVKGEHRIFHWHEIAGLDLSRINFLDVRTPQEYENGTIREAVNIPVDELRARMGELDKSKPVYLFCQIGLRGYVAYRMLQQNGFDTYNLSGGYRLYNAVMSKISYAPVIREAATKEDSSMSVQINVNACGLQCPGPITKLYDAVKDAKNGDIITITATDPGFVSDIEAWCRRTGNTLLRQGTESGQFFAEVRKCDQGVKDVQIKDSADGKNIIVFSGDLDKAIASFIIANGAAAMGRKVSMFFTFWGLNILRKSTHVKVNKNVIERMFGFMMPRGSTKLGLSRMNMGGMGAKMIRGIMKNKNVDSLEDMIKLAMQNGVEVVACTMSMDLMGIKLEELIDGVQTGGVAAMLGHAEESDMSLFI